jgi:hypothetical protein
VERCWNASKLSHFVSGAKWLKVGWKDAVEDRWGIVLGSTEGQLVPALVVKVVNLCRRAALKAEREEDCTKMVKVGRYIRKSSKSLPWVDSLCKGRQRSGDLCLATQDNGRSWVLLQGSPLLDSLCKGDPRL